MSSRPAQLVVVAGTGTEVGKTWAAVRLVTELRSLGRSVAARKPAQSFDPPPRHTDADLLAAATGASPFTVCPGQRWYPVAMAPPMAADALGLQPIFLADLVDELAASWSSPVDVGLIELAGGPWSPMAHDGDGIDLTRALSPDRVVLIADAGLGTINAVRPAVEVLGDAAPTVVLLNRYDDGDELHRRNRDWLRDRAGVHVVTSVAQMVDRLTSP